MDEADKGLEKPKNYAQTIINKSQPPIPCLDLLAASQARQAKFYVIPIISRCVPSKIMGSQVNSNNVLRSMSSFDYQIYN